MLSSLWKHGQNWSLGIMADAIDLTEPQSEFFHSDSTYTAAVAGFGSGKTHVATTKVLAQKFAYPTINQAYLAPTYSLIRDIFYPNVAELLTAHGHKFRINKSENKVHIQGFNDIICRTMDNPDMIVGWEVGDAFMDEFDLLHEDKALQVMRKVSARCRQKYPDGKKNQKWVTTTPEGFKATYKLFKKEPLTDSRLVQMSTYSNQHNLPEDYITMLRDQYPEQLIEAYLNGQFVNLTAGAVYYTFDRQIHHSEYVTRPREPVHIGIDFNVYNMAGIVHVIRNGVPYAVDEFVGLRDTPDMIDAIKMFYKDHKVYVYPDASGKGTSSKSATLSDIKLLKDAGFTVKAKSKNPFVKDRVISMNSAFEKQKYFVNTKRCPIYTEALEQQIYDVLGRPDKSSGLDHPLDAAGYFIFWYWPVKKSNLTKKIVRGVVNAQ